MAGYPYQGIYDPFGYQRRNRNIAADPVNPLPANAIKADCGDAGQDGYSVLSRASRYSGERPDIGGEDEFLGPRPEDG